VVKFSARCAGASRVMVVNFNESGETAAVTQESANLPKSALEALFDDRWLPRVASCGAASLL